MITDGLSPLSILAFVALVLGSGVGAVLFAFSLVLKRPDVAKLIARLALGGVGAYLAMLLLLALTSHDRVLGPNEEKHICEVDCHLAYSVVDVKTQGTRYVVTVKVRFDETTIASQRGMAPLTPNSRYVAILDSQGRRYEAPSDALQRQLVPGQAYTTDLVFDVPDDAHDLRLILASGDPETRVLIGHENSFFHGKTTFRVSA